MTEEKIEEAAVEQAPGAEAGAAVNTLERTITLKVSTEEVNALVEKALKRYAKTARMPGFRRGHVPMNHVRGMYGAKAFEDAVNEKIGQAWVEAARQSQLAVVGNPEIEPVKSEEEGVMSFTAKFEVMPSIPTLDFASLSLKRYVCTVDEAAVDKTIDVMKKQRVAYHAEEGRAAQDEDAVTCDFAGRLDGEAFEGGSATGFRFVLGQGRMLPEFEDAVRGMAKGDKKTFPLTFPEDYGAKNLAGKTVEFDIEVKGVEAPEYPVVDDAFAASLGINGGLAAMRADVRTNLEREVKARVANKTNGELFETVSASLTYAVPKFLVNQEAEGMLNGLVSQYKARGLKDKQIPKFTVGLFTAEAEKRVRLGLFIHDLLAKENLDAKPEQIEAQAELIATAYEKPEEVKNFMLNDQASRSNMVARIREENAAEFILGKAKTEDVEVEFDKVMSGQF